ncbi:craniofacial development protein 2-like [Zootermopsis nevadensis]|uniref:craniofacial development protein 2-like n=1 Tax=Zootermopsis nevadensis TaxID=136037 RepID=UPI000B8E7FF0|nr:craniofacial development protein 2-like [Zootermopsis nevadensis]
MGSRAKEGLWIIVDEEVDKKVSNWNPINSRIMIMDLEMQQQVSRVQVYAPTEDADIIEKDQFFTDLQRVANDIAESRRKILIMGDLSSWVGNVVRTGHGAIGKYNGEKIRNENAKRLIEFCIHNNLINGNTFYIHKNIHKITFEGQGVRS